MSCDGYLILTNPLLYYVSANTCLNHLKLLRRKLRDIMQKIFEKLVVIATIAMMSVPGLFNGYHKTRHDFAVTRQNQLEFWNLKAKQIFS